MSTLHNTVVIHPFPNGEGAFKLARADMFSESDNESIDPVLLRSSSKFWLQPVVRGTSAGHRGASLLLNKRRSVAMPIYKSDQRSDGGVVPGSDILSAAMDMSRRPRKTTDDFGSSVSLVEIVGECERSALTCHHTSATAADVPQPHRTPSGDAKTSRQSRYSLDLKHLLVQQKLLQTGPDFSNGCTDSDEFFKAEASDSFLKLQGHSSGDTIPAGAPKNFLTVSCDMSGLPLDDKEIIDARYSLPDRPRGRDSSSRYDCTVGDDGASGNNRFDGCDDDMDKDKNDRGVGRIRLGRLTMLNTLKSSVVEIVASSTKTLKKKSRATIHLASNRLVEFRKRSSSAAWQFPQQFVGPLCDIYPAGIIIRPSRIEPDAWRIFMGANEDWPRQPAEVSGDEIAAH